MTIDTTKLADGPHLIVLSVSNTVGFSTSKSFQLLVLNTPPAVVVGSPADGSTVNGMVQVSYFVKSSYLSNVTANIDGSPISSSGSAAWNSANFPDGPHTLTVTATDQAGNVGSATVHFSSNNQGQVATFRNYLIATAAVAAVAGAVVTLAISRARRPKPPSA
jgi:hypothetical protein